MDFLWIAEMAESQKAERKVQVMYCAKCGKEIRNGSKFCGFCGAPVTASVKEAKIVPVKEAEIAPIKEVEIAPITVSKEKLENPTVEPTRMNGNVPEKNRKKTGMVFVFAVMGLIVGLLAGVFLMKNIKETPDSENSFVTAQETQRKKSGDEPEVIIEETEEDDFTEESEAEESQNIPETDGSEAETGWEKTSSAETFASEIMDGDVITSENLGEYILPECTIRLYTTEELKKLTLEELRLARNEIYARHGRSFQAEDLKQYFSEKSWYEPLYSAKEMDALGDSILNEFEVENRDRIVQVEAELKGEGSK